MAAIREDRKKWLAERLRKIAAEESDADVAASFVRLAEDVEAGRTPDDRDE